MYNNRINWIMFGVVLALWVAGQALIGTYLPEDGSFHYDAPADGDFLYYAGIINQMKHDIPPQNPSYGSVPLSQSFIQYYPTMLLSYLINPYLSMRIMNIIFLFGLGHFLRKYFPHTWGLGLIVIAAGSVGIGIINALGVDLIARAFNHLPFFIVFLIALFEKKSKLMRYGALVLLGWLHGFLSLLAVIYFAVRIIVERFSRKSMVEFSSCFLGIAGAALLTLGVADKPWYFMFSEGFGFNLKFIWMHAVVAVVLAVLARKRQIYILLAISLLFGTFFQYNPFFPVFMLYFIGGWAIMEMAQNEILTHTALALAGILLIGFLYSGYEKYGPQNRGYYPHIDKFYEKAGEWLAENSDPRAVLLTFPIQDDWTSRLMEKRALYLGTIPHVAHLGIDWTKRGQNLTNYFRKLSVYIEEIDFVVYGPDEKRVFPDFVMGDRPIYHDDFVEIWKVGRGH